MNAETLSLRSGRMALRNPDLVWPNEALPADQAEAMRDIAWDRYLTTPHADPLVGRERYRAEIDAINKLEGRS